MSFQVFKPNPCNISRWFFALTRSYGPQELFHEISTTATNLRKIWSLSRFFVKSNGFEQSENSFFLLFKKRTRDGKVISHGLAWLRAVCFAKKITLSRRSI